MTNRLQSVVRHFVFIVALLAVASSEAAAQYCPVTSTYFTGNYSLGCTIGTCWAPAPFPGSTAKAGSAYPSTNYACAATTPRSSELENTLYTYDAHGNLTSTKDPLAHTTTNSFDALNRLIKVLDLASGATKYAYNGDNAPVQVTDPVQLRTTYSVNGFGETAQLNSPDTGITTYDYNVAGSLGYLSTRQDARGTLAIYTYDALGRVTLESYTGDGTEQYTYDNCTYGKGRLCSASDPDSSASFTYDARGRVATKTQAVEQTPNLAVGYSYDAFGRMDAITYPSGMIVFYGFNANGQVVSTGAANMPVVLSGVVYSPFGTVRSWTWGNGQAYTRGIDADGRVYGYPRNTHSVTLSYDYAGRVYAITDSNNASLNQAFGYDAVDRIVSDAPGPGGTQPTRGYTYDSNGNRKTSTVNGVNTTYNYPSPLTTNRLSSTTGGHVASYTYDAMGNITGDGLHTFSFNARARMVSEAFSGAAYNVNAFGQRVKKIVGGATTVFVYDERGQLLGEYDGAGNQLAEHIYLDGMPVAVMKFVGGVPKVYQVYPDHLGTPRAVVDPVVAQPVWQWHNIDPFGGNLPNENPAGLGIFKYNLRFPGQYYDAETGLHYNYYRDYDPTIGRYVESDPIELKGGINTYAYSDGSPTTKTDPLGLATFACTKPLHALGGEGTRSGPDIWGNPLYHQYLCINDGKGGYTCGGQDQRGQKWYDPINGPGKPSNDKYDPQTCEQKEPDNNCIEQCLLKKFAGPRPRYGIPFGTDCQEWSDDALKDCQKQCKKT